MKYKILMFLFAIVMLISLASAAVWQESLNDGLVVYYGLNENTGTSAYSNATTNTQTLSNSAMWVTNGKIGSALKSDGSYTAIGSGITSGTITSYTISFWRNATTDGIFYTFLGNSPDNTPAGGQFVFDEKETSACFGLRAGGQTSLVGNTVEGGCIINRWVHHVFIITNGQPVIYYKNGTNVENSSNTPSFTSFDGANALFMFKNVDAGISTNNAIDEVAIWNRSLTTAEIQQLYNDGDGLPYSTRVVNTILSRPTNNNQIFLNYSNLFSPLLEANMTSTSYTLSNITFFIWNSTNNIINQTTFTSSGTSNSSQASYSLGFGNYKWNAYGCGVDGSLVLCNWATSNRTFTKGAVFNSYSAPSPVTETTSANFEVNVSVGSGVSVQTAILTYNGTNYTSTSKTEVTDGNYTIKRTITIPQGTNGFGSESRNYYWIITLADETTGATFTQQSATQSQTVSELVFTLCSAENIYSVLNFTMFDETTGVEIDATTNATTFEATFNIGANVDSLVKNYSISNISVGVSRFNFCTNTSGVTLYANMIAEYTAVDYSDKNYYLTSATLTTVENEISLFLIPTSEAIQFFLEVIRGLSGLPDVTVTIAKYFVGEGVYKTVEIDKTDDAGEFTAYLELDKNYRFTITDDGDILGIVDKVASCEAAPCEISLNLGSTLSNPFSFYDTAFAENVVYNLSYNRVTKMVIFDFIDTTGLATYFRMEILRTMYNQTGIKVYDNTVYSSSGSISFNLTGYPDGDYRVNTYISRSPESFIAFITLLLSSSAATLGMTGLLIALIIILVVVFSLAMSPSFLILSVPLSLQFVRVIGIAYIDTTLLMGVWLLAIFLVVMMRK